MPIIVAGAPVVIPSYQYPVIGYDNLLEQGTVTGNPNADKENAFDWLTYDVWTTGAASGWIAVDLGASSKPCDYFAFFAHDLHNNGGEIKLQYDQGAGWVDVADTITIPGDAKPIVVLFDQISAPKWRVYVTCTAACTIGVLSFGKRLDLERGFYVGFTPPNFARTDRLLNAGTQNGQFLGRSLIRTGAKGQIDLDHITPAWVRSYLDPFILHARTKGWFLKWNPTQWAAEAAYCWTVGTPAPQHSHVSFMRIAIPFEGRVE